MFFKIQISYVIFVVTFNYCCAATFSSLHICFFYFLHKSLPSKLEKTIKRSHCCWKEAFKRKSHKLLKQLSIEVSQPDEEYNGKITFRKSNGLDTFVACSGVDQRALLLQENDNEITVDAVS